MRVGLVGATGMVGQHYLHLLRNHPWFELTHVSATVERTGQPYPQTGWYAPGALPQLTLDSPEAPDCDLLFLCANRDARAYAAQGLRVVVSTSQLRDDPSVPLIIPEINGHTPWTGNLVSKPNCALQSYLLPLWPLHQQFGLAQVVVTTLQSLSGAGTSLMHTTDPDPFIPGEEEKCESEPFRIFGETFPLSVQCHRVPRPFGHSASVSVAFNKRPTRAAILEAWDAFEGLNLPTAPERPVRYVDERLPLEPMTVTVGRLRECAALHWQFTALSHNVIRGAAGGGLLIAEQWITHAQEPLLHRPAEELSLSRS
jgi:aspartate-semialdehyde dehydrogenase